MGLLPLYILLSSPIHGFFYYYYIVITMIRHLLYSLKNCVQAVLSPALNLLFPPPNRAHPASTRSMSNDLEKKLEVFKTITVMLANLSRTSALPPTDNLQISQWSPLQRRVLKVSDALAQLLVSQHEVVAVSTNLFGPSLNMVTSADQTETQTEAESPLTFLDKIWKLVFTRNSRSKDTAQEHPTIIAAEEPHDLNGRSAIRYMEDLLEHWRVLVLCKNLVINTLTYFVIGPSRHHQLIYGSYHRFLCTVSIIV
jgi:hypothetical protein